MGATVIVAVKIMPESPSVDLAELKASAQKKMEVHGAKGIAFEEQPVAFGLKAVLLKMAMPEEKGTDVIEKELSEISGVSSIIIEDYRRAFG